MILENVSEGWSPCCSACVCMVPRAPPRGALSPEPRVATTLKNNTVWRIHTCWTLKYLLSYGRWSLCWWNLPYLIFSHHRSQRAHWVWTWVYFPQTPVMGMGVEGYLSKLEPWIAGNKSSSFEWQLYIVAFISRPYTLQFPPPAAVSVCSNSLFQITYNWVFPAEICALCTSVIVGLEWSIHDFVDTQTVSIFVPVTSGFWKDFVLMPSSQNICDWFSLAVYSQVNHLPPKQST